MALPSASLLAVLAMRASGDLGEMTAWTTKTGKVIWYQKEYPKEPPTIAQLHQRARVAASGFDWRQLTSEDKKLWSKLVSGAHTCLSPFAAYMAAALNPASHEVLKTCARQADLSGLPPFRNR